MACYRRDRELQREINASLNVVAQSWNAGNSVIYFGKGRRHPRQPAMSRSCWCCACGSCRAPWVYLNTLIIQDVLGGR